MQLHILTIDTPIGRIGLFARSGKLERIVFPDDCPDVDQGDSFSVGSRTDPTFKEAADFIERYFKGEHVSWAGKPIPEGTEFQTRVWNAAAAIPFGTTVTYGELAEMAGNPRAARAVGTAMKHNPLPILIPCHRVIAANGKLGGFGGGLDMKRWLLRHEGVKIEG